MQCFICVTYMIILCTAQPTRDQTVATTHEKRSLFQDVIESLRIRSQLPEEINHSDDNNLSQNYNEYGFDNEPPELPSDADFVPRRNDRIEMPTLKYRFPKSLQMNGSDIKVENKKEDIIVYVNTPSDIPEPRLTTHKPKKEPKPNRKVNFVKQNESDEDMTDVTSDLIDDSYRPVINKMADSSQIGNREYQTVIKPTVIVNFRGSVSHRDSEIRLEKRNNPKRKQDLDSARNIFNINQEIKLERPNGTIDVEGLRHLSSAVKQGVNVLSDKVKEKVDDDMTACETPAAHAPPAPGSDRSARHDVDDNILQIVVTL
ncbi:PREDICTED: uncharacterized protein LOC106100118 [Papilio polytes]|uniref:uncharacterized protein LOC106100118 n=1 Tax=Papilio polytes TaxID=76194 RepID=UPI0006765366|nr:PREDICTED: uncharacterized protein LOC106100118 [Papilio polytes]